MVVVLAPTPHEQGDKEKYFPIIHVCMRLNVCMCFGVYECVCVCVCENWRRLTARRLTHEWFVYILLAVVVSRT